MFCKFCDIEIKSIKKVQSPVTPHLYNLYECKNCSSRFFDHNEHDVSLSHLYENLAEQRANFPVEFSPKPYWKNQEQILTSLLSKKPDSVLDVGSRTGDFLMHFDSDIKRVGVELSEYFCEISKKRGLETHQSFLEDINFDETFDIVSSYAIMEHLVDPLKFMETLNSLVKPGGILVILIPSHQTLKAKFLKQKWHMYSPPEHLNFYSKTFLDHYLADSNFSLVKRYYSIGGMFKPLKNVQLLKPIHSKIPALLDSFPFIKKIPVYDHMFSYYKKLS